MFCWFIPNLSWICSVNLKSSLQLFPNPPNWLLCYLAILLYCSWQFYPKKQIRTCLPLYPPLCALHDFSGGLNPLSCRCLRNVSGSSWRAESEMEHRGRNSSSDYLHPSFDQAALFLLFYMLSDYERFPFRKGSKVPNCLKANRQGQVWSLVVECFSRNRGFRNAKNFKIN